jgi:hypothetical protein
MQHTIASGLELAEVWMNIEHERMRKAQTQHRLRSKDAGLLSFLTSLYAHLNFEEIQVGLEASNMRAITTSLIEYSVIEAYICPCESVLFHNQDLPLGACSDLERFPRRTKNSPDASFSSAIIQTRPRRT